ncbi:MAG: DUF975 family protein [Clostridia bacterium]|nr:DUF975 family protein [Clostridia bacterium]
MDQNQGYQVHDASFYRAKARNMLTCQWWLAIGAVFLLILLAGGVGTVSVNVNVDENTIKNAGANPTFFALFFAAIAGAVSLVTWALHFFVGAPVQLGYQKFQLNLIDRGDARIGDLFSYFQICYGKSLLLKLLSGLIMLATSLPTVIGSAMFSAFLISALLNVPGFEALVLGGQVQISMEEFESLGANVLAELGASIGWILLAFLIYLVGVVGSIVLRIVVGYRIAFAQMILAEYPEISATDALRNSASLMKGKVWRLFCLKFSFIGWHLARIGAYLGALLILTILTVLSVFIPIFGALVALLCALGLLLVTIAFAFAEYPLQAYINAACAAFYDDIANRRAAREAEFPSINPDDYVPGGEKAQEKTEVAEEATEEVTEEVTEETAEETQTASSEDHESALGEQAEQEDTQES